MKDNAVKKIGIIRLMSRPLLRESILYIIMGIITTIVNIITFYIIRHSINISAAAANIIAWAISVFFAFVTNRRFVFNSGKSSFFNAPVQLFLFFIIRAVSGAAETLIVFILIDMLSFADLPVKLFSNSIIIILNYIAGKWFVFKKSSKKTGNCFAGESK